MTSHFTQQLMETCNNHVMNRTAHKFCAWSGTLCLLLMVVGFVLLAGFIPARPPGETAEQTAQFLSQNRDLIKWGLIVAMFGAPLLMTFAASISIHMRRIEGRYAVLAMTEMGLGAILVLEFIYLIFFWQTATYRADRSPELIQLASDMGWIPFVGLTSTIVLQVSVFGVAILTDRRNRPVFPRWLGYYNLWVALMFLPGTFNVFYLDGPLSRNGIIAWYIPLAVFATWLVITSFYLSRAVDGMPDDEPVPFDGTPPRASDDATSTEISSASRGQ
jgi:uncharacterized membrane protein (DUF485 family)